MNSVEIAARTAYLSVCLPVSLTTVRSFHCVCLHSESFALCFLASHVERACRVDCCFDWYLVGWWCFQCPAVQAVAHPAQPVPPTCVPLAYQALQVHALPFEVRFHVWFSSVVGGAFLTVVVARLHMYKVTRTSSCGNGDGRSDPGSISTDMVDRCRQKGRPSCIL